MEKRFRKEALFCADAIIIVIYPGRVFKLFGHFC